MPRAKLSGPQADKPAAEAEALPQVEAQAAVHEATPGDAAVHEPQPADANAGAGHAGEEPTIGAPESRDVAATGDEGGALNPIPIHEHPTPGHESAAEEYNTASEGGDLEATAAPAHDGAEIEAIKEEVRQVQCSGFAMQPPRPTCQSGEVVRTPMKHVLMATQSVVVHARRHSACVRLGCCVFRAACVWC